MSKALIFILLSFCVFYIMTRTVYLRITKEGGIKIELHLPITAVVLYKAERDDNKYKNKKRGKIKTSISYYHRIIKCILALINESEIEIIRFSLPAPDEHEKAYKYKALFYTTLAYVKNKSKKLTFKDDGFLLFSDSSSLQLDISFKLYLYRLISLIFTVVYSITKEKRRKRKV